MAIVLNATDRKAISRRIVKIPTENLGFDLAITNMLAAKATFKEVDDVNKKFHDNYLNQADRYGNEISLKTGYVRGTYTEVDIQNAGQMVTGNLFYPPTYTFMIPKIIDEVNGKPITTTSPFEKALTDNPPLALTATGDGVKQIYDLLMTGFNYGVGSTTLTAQYVPGATTLAVATSAPFVAGEYIYVTSGTNTAIFVVVAIPGALSLTVYAVCEPTANLSIGSTVTRVFAGFTQAERQTLVATVGAQQDILDALSTTGANAMINKVLAWETNLNSQLVELNANDDNVAPRPTQILAEIVDITASKVILDAWQALPNTGVGAKFDNAPLATLDIEADARLIRIALRITAPSSDPTTWSGQIVTVLGGVIDNGDGTYSAVGGDTTAIYYVRYVNLNIRINKMFGSYQRYFYADRGLDIINKNKANNIILLAQYNNVARATTIVSFVIGYKNVTVTDVSIFTIGDNIYIMDEALAEMSATIQDIGGNILTLNNIISNQYTTAQLARVMKVI